MLNSGDFLPINPSKQVPEGRSSGFQVTGEVVGSEAVPRVRWAWEPQASLGNRTPPNSQPQQ